MDLLLGRWLLRRTIINPSPQQWWADLRGRMWGRLLCSVNACGLTLPLGAGPFFALVPCGSNALHCLSPCSPVLCGLDALGSCALPPWRSVCRFTALALCLDAVSINNTN